MTYEATGSEQLSLQLGQLVQVRKKTDTGWWEGESQVFIICMYVYIYIYIYIYITHLYMISHKIYATLKSINQLKHAMICLHHQPSLSSLRWQLSEPSKSNDGEGMQTGQSVPVSSRWTVKQIKDAFEIWRETIAVSSPSRPSFFNNGVTISYLTLMGMQCSVNDQLKYIRVIWAIKVVNLMSVNFVYTFVQIRGQKRRVGWFPANYVKLLSQSGPRSSTDPKSAGSPTQKSSVSFIQ